MSNVANISKNHIFTARFVVCTLIEHSALQYCRTVPWPLQVSIAQSEKSVIEVLKMEDFSKQYKTCASLYLLSLLTKKNLMIKSIQLTVYFTVNSKSQKARIRIVNYYNRYATGAELQLSVLLFVTLCMVSSNQ